MPIIAQNNLITDGGFENQEMYERGEIARIASFSQLGESTQSSNPKMATSKIIEKGAWYKKAADTGYLRATIINTDSEEGAKSLLLSIGKNSSQKNLDKWETTALVQFIEIETSRIYELKFCAKSNIDCEKIFAGLVTKQGKEINGSQWINIDSEWKEYSIEIVLSKSDKAKYKKGGLDMLAVVFGLSASYNDNLRTNQTSVIIDNIRLYVK